MPHRVTELHCIMPLENIPSVLANGILSHENVSKLPHASVAMAEIQERRQNKVIHQGLRLHQYANLYFHARNPMLFVRRYNDVCVLRISNKVLQIQNAVITDQNAASDYVRFYDINGYVNLNFDDIYSRSWTHPEDRIREMQHKSKKCAEVLIPGCVPPSYIIGAYVANTTKQKILEGLGFPYIIHVDSDFFFL